jgi:hypothetical protein
MLPLCCMHTATASNTCCTCCTTEPEQGSSMQASPLAQPQVREPPSPHTRDRDRCLHRCAISSPSCPQPPAVLHLHTRPLRSLRPYACLPTACLSCFRRCAARAARLASPNKIDRFARSIPANAHSHCTTRSPSRGHGEIPAIALPVGVADASPAHAQESALHCARWRMKGVRVMHIS